MQNLDLALIGNCTVGALIDARGDDRLGLLPALRRRPGVLLAARRERRATTASPPSNSPIASAPSSTTSRTRRSWSRGSTTATAARVEITDFAPRFRQYGRMFRPMMLVRRIRRLSRQPAHDAAPAPGLRLRRSAPGSHLGQQPHPLCGAGTHAAADHRCLAHRDPAGNAVLPRRHRDPAAGRRRDRARAADEVGRRFLEETAQYWREWVRFLGIPFEWQEAVIRAAITLKLNAFDDTGAIVAAMTTSIPEAAGSGRNWDYRYCWLRDGYFVVNALNRLGATRTMERYLGYIVNIAAECRRRAAAAGLRHRRPRRARRARRYRRWPAIAAWGRCASATRPTARCSTTSMARPSWPRPTSSSTSA